MAARSLHRGKNNTRYSVEERQRILEAFRGNKFNFNKTRAQLGVGMKTLQNLVRDFPGLRAEREAALAKRMSAFEAAQRLGLHEKVLELLLTALKKHGTKRNAVVRELRVSKDHIAVLLQRYGIRVVEGRFDSRIEINPRVAGIVEEKAARWQLTPEQKDALLRLMESKGMGQVLDFMGAVEKANIFSFRLPREHVVQKLIGLIASSNAQSFSERLTGLRESLRTEVRENVAQNIALGRMSKRKNKRFQ